MRSKSNGTIQRAQRLKHPQGEGPNWVLIAGGALLSTLSIRLGYMVKNAFDTRRLRNTRNSFKDVENSAAKRRSGACPLHSDLYCFTRDDDNCYNCFSGMSDGRVVIKRTPTSPISKEGDDSLPLVTIPAAESNKENGTLWALSSPERIELPRKPFHHSNSSDSPCVSESGSDIFSKREVIHKLRQQLKRRDEMIMEMQSQITELQNSLSSQMTDTAHLRSQLDSTNRDLFDSEREIQRLRKVIADHCVADAASSPKKSSTAQQWHTEGMNGHANNGYIDSFSDLGLNSLNCVGVEKGRDAERVDMLRREVGELKEVIEGKEFLLQSYKEQKVELSAKLNELQLRLASSQVPSIL